MPHSTLLNVSDFETRSLMSNGLSGQGGVKVPTRGVTLGTKLLKTQKYALVTGRPRTTRQQSCKQGGPPSAASRSATPLGDLERRVRKSR